MGQMLFLTPNQWCEGTEGNSKQWPQAHLFYIYHLGKWHWSLTYLLPTDTWFLQPKCVSSQIAYWLDQPSVHSTSVWST